jgi:LmbE family N-acetylglucosaminyl deacetylase
MTVLDNLKKNQTCLVIAAHPDDEVLGVGGTILKLHEMGIKVHLFFATGGKAGRVMSSVTQSAKIEKEKKILKAEMEKSCKELKVHDFYALDLPDNRLDTVSKMDLSIALSNYAKKIDPRIVFTHHHSDYNWDHNVLFEASLMAFRPNVGDFYPDALMSYEVLSSTERSFQTPSHMFCPTMYVDIAETLSGKVRALKHYRSELKQYPHPRSVEGVEILAKKRGMECGLKAAEAFQTIRTIFR